jgi:hypothetical protein
MFRGTSELVRRAARPAMGSERELPRASFTSSQYHPPPLRWLGHWLDAQRLLQFRVEFDRCQLDADDGHGRAAAHDR